MGFQNVYGNPWLQRPNFNLRKDIFRVKFGCCNLGFHIHFGIPRVHRLLLCIWFPLDTPVLTLDLVKRRSVASKVLTVFPSSWWALLLPLFNAQILAWKLETRSAKVLYIPAMASDLTLVPLIYIVWNRAE